MRYKPDRNVHINLELALTNFQNDHFKWLEYNFPGQTDHQGLLGVIEEVGELSHAHLKYEQGIRGYNRERYRLDAEDAIGDILIYLASYCNTNDLDLGRAAKNAWEEVSARDWIQYPETGRAPEPSTEVH